MTEAWPFWRSVPRFEREYSFRDLRLAFQALLRPPKEEAGWVEEFFSPHFHHFARSGTECLYLILKLLKLRPKSRVGVPLYCCSAVFEAIVAAGHVPIFLDVEVNTYCLDSDFLRQRRDQLDALVVVHVFGYPNDLGAVRDSLGGRDIPVIEDCAHSLFSAYQNRQTGMCADASFLTFGMHKPAAAGGGAVLLVNNPDLAKSARQELPRLGAESRSRECLHSLICMARSISYHRAAYGALLASPFGHGRDTGGWTPRVNGTSMLGHSFFPGQIRIVDRVLIAQRVGGFRRKLPMLAENTQALRHALRGSEIALPDEPDFGKWNHFMVPARFSSAERRDSARRFLIRRRVDTAPLYQNCARNARRFGYSGDCPKAELVARTLFTVPNHASMTSREIAYIGESLRLSAEQIPRQE